MASAPLLRSLFAVGLVVSSAICASACSSKDVAIAGGGVKVQLSQPTGTGSDPSKHCTDTGTNGLLSLVDTQADGADHLLTDGQGNARVTCSIGDTSFNVHIDRQGQSFDAHGTVHATATGFESSDAAVSIYLSAGSYHTDPASPCTIEFDSSYGGGGASATSFLCPGLLADSAGMCAITGGIFKFTNCN